MMNLRTRQKNIVGWIRRALCVVIHQVTAHYVLYFGGLRRRAPCTESLIVICFNVIFLFFSSAASAQETGQVGSKCIPPGGTRMEQYLFCIQQYTQGILTSVNTLPDYIKAGSAYFIDWTITDEADKSVVPTMQGSFTTLTNENTKNSDAQTALQSQLVTNFFKDPTDITRAKALTAEQLPNANDLEYQILLDIPYFKKDPRQEKDPSINPPMNYLYNASGINILHPLPNPLWQGKPERIQRYSSYYNTISAAQTYNGYVLSDLYANKQNNNTLSDAQKKLVEQVSGKDWLTQVGSDHIGLVLRHLLMFESQMFVLMTRMLDVERQILTTQAMTNSLLVTLNLGNEDTLIKQANGSIP